MDLKGKTSAEQKYFPPITSSRELSALGIFITLRHQQGNDDSVRPFLLHIQNYSAIAWYWCIYPQVASLLENCIFHYLEFSVILFCDVNI